LRTRHRSTLRWGYVSLRGKSLKDLWGCFYTVAGTVALRESAPQRVTPTCGHRPDPDQRECTMKRIAVVASLTLLLSAGSAAADPDFRPGNSSKGAE
jgi:hypothetical protein